MCTFCLQEKELQDYLQDEYLRHTFELSEQKRKSSRYNKKETNIFWGVLRKKHLTCAFLTKGHLQEMY